MQAFIAKERAELVGEFCRGCGYCMPCPVGIEINNCARMALMIRRAPTDIYFNEANQAKMQQIKDCLKCGQCKSRCPYSLGTPALLEKHLADYEVELAKYKSEM